MIRKFFLISLLLVIFLGINFSYIRSYYYNYLGDKYYSKQDLEKSIQYFTKANNDASNYNLGNIYYVKGDYNSAIKHLEKVGEDSYKTLLFRTNHNLGNSYYRVGETDLENRLKYYKTSLNYYEKALNLIYDKETKANYDFVLEKIKDLEKKEENSNKDSNEENSNKKEEKQEQSNKNEGKNTDSDSGNKKESNDQASQNKNQINSGEKPGQEQSNNLSQEQIQSIEEYKQMLKKEQDYNSEGFNKLYQGENTDIFESFFNNSLLENDNKKDW